VPGCFCSGVAGRVHGQRPGVARLASLAVNQMPTGKSSRCGAVARGVGAAWWVRAFSKQGANCQIRQELPNQVLHRHRECPELKPAHAGHSRESTAPNTLQGPMRRGWGPLCESRLLGVTDV